MLRFDQQEPDPFGLTSAGRQHWGGESPAIPARRHVLTGVSASFLTLLLANCAEQPKPVATATAETRLPPKLPVVPPQYQDNELGRLMAGLDPRSAPMGEPVPPVNGGGVALLAGANTGITIRHGLQVAGALYRLGPQYKPFVDDQNPKFLLDTSVALLRKRYPQMVFAHSIEEAQSRAARLLLVLDIRRSFSTNPAERHIATIALVGLDQDAHPITRLTINAWADVTPTKPTFRNAERTALIAFRSEIRRVLTV